VGEFTGSLGPARSAGMSDVFVLKIAGATGEMRLLRTFGGKGADLANAVALLPPDNVIVGGTFGAYVDASVSEVNFGRGGVRASDGADGFLVALSAEGETRWTSVVGEQGDDEVVALATREGAAAGIIAGVATVAAVSLTGANFHTLPWLPAQVQDLNIGIVALAVNFIVLIVVSLAMRLAAAPAHAAAE